MEIGILQTGRTPDEMLGKHGDYDDLFKRIIEPLTSADYTERFEELFKCHRSARGEIQATTSWTSQAQGASK